MSITAASRGGSSVAATRSSDADAAATAEPTALPGRTTIADRALRAVAEQATAVAFGVKRDQVSVQLGSSAGGLALRVSSPLPVPDLDDTEAVHAGPTVIERIHSIQQNLHESVADLTGRAVTRVDVTVTGAIIPPRRRVR
ncbi:hypothetical protein ACFXQA_14680 [Microbacterium sp. P07]|uniref:hypothetical protein n=1 Tax=Microbacterium sp. P07 TaxID=3366952 RepID=UPI003746CCD7